MRRIFAIMVPALALVALLSVVAWQQYRAFLDRPLIIGQSGLQLQVSKGATVRSVIRELEGRGVTTSDWRWRLLTRLQATTIRAGEYALTAELRPLDLLNLLASGEVIQYRFTIIEGWTFRQLIDALDADPVLDQQIAGMHGDARVMEAIGAGFSHPEGWFLPETYQYVRGDSDLDILRRAHKEMIRVLETVWNGRQDNLPLSSSQELLTLASIVEKESALDSERAEIAGVFVRRLLAGWRLETDPTVIYGLGESWDGDIRRRDLDADTPYNTYTRYGLPPTPIAMPGKSAIEAAATPAIGTSMFFVASGSGGHVVSDTLEQHNAAVRQMLRKKP